MTTSKRRFVLDGRAAALADRIEQTVPPGAMFNPSRAADLIEMSKEFLSHARNNGYGPKFSQELKHGRVDYYRDDLLEWLRERARIFAERKAAKSEREAARKRAMRLAARQHEIL
jgi:hypothetical protein